jgi:hypothetical protein
MDSPGESSTKAVRLGVAMIVARNSEPRKGDSSDGRRAAGMGAAGPGRAPDFERGGAQAARRLQCLRLVRVGRQAEVRRPPGHQRTPPEGDGDQGAYRASGRRGSTQTSAAAPPDNDRHAPPGAGAPGDDGTVRRAPAGTASRPTGTVTSHVRRTSRSHPSLRQTRSAGNAGHDEHCRGEAAAASGTLVWNRR